VRSKAPSDPLDALLARLARHGDAMVAGWARAFRAGGKPRKRRPRRKLPERSRACRAST